MSSQRCLPIASTSAGTTVIHLDPADRKATV